METILVAGTKIVLTKTKIKGRQTSDFKVGEKRSGTLSYDYREGKPLYFKERHNDYVTSEIFSCKQKGNEITLETRTSVYNVRVVKDDNDNEFQKWIEW